MLKDAKSPRSAHLHGCDVCAYVKCCRVRCAKNRRHRTMPTYDEQLIETLKRNFLTLTNIPIITAFLGYMQFVSLKVKVLIYAPA